MYLGGGNKKSGGSGWLGMAGKLAGTLFGIGSESRANRNDRRNAEQQYQNQRKLNQQGADLQMDMWNKTNYKAQLEHMKDAGLNPGLMYGMGGGGGTTTGSQGGGSASKAITQKQMGIEGAMAGAQAALLEAQTKNVNADTANKESENPNISKEGNLIDMNILKESKTIESLEQNIQKSKAEVYKLKQEGKLLKGGYDSQIKILKNEAVVTGLDIIMRKVDIREGNQKITESKARITNMVEQIALGKDQIEVNKLLAQIKADFPTIWNVIGKSVQDFMDDIRGLFGVQTYRSE